MDAPLPNGVLDPPAEPGLRVSYADDGFLLATKLVAQRAKDADDVVLLKGRVGLGAATPEQLEAHVRSYYTDRATLEFIVDGNDVDGEITLLAQDASQRLQRVTRQVARGGEPPGTERQQRLTDLERHIPRPGFDDRSPGRAPEL